MAAVTQDDEVPESGPALEPVTAHARASGDLMIAQPAVPGVLSVIRRQLQAWVVERRWPRIEAEDIELAVHEAVANVIEHAYLPHAPGPVSLHAWVAVHPRTRVRRVLAVVVDRGQWAAHQPESPPPHCRGRGLLVMRGCMADVRVQRSARGSTVILISPTVDPLPGTGTGG